VCSPANFERSLFTRPINTLGEVGGRLGRCHFPFFRAGGGLPCLWKGRVAHPRSSRNRTWRKTTWPPRPRNHKITIKIAASNFNRAQDLLPDFGWPVVPGHRDGATARDGQPHEKTDSRRHDRLREILNPPVTEDELERLHAADLETTWFGKLA
jgi:hypothetical protein